MELWITMIVLALVLAALVLEVTSADVIFLAGLAATVATGVVGLEQALSGFANGTLVALAALYVVATALRETGALAKGGRILLGTASSLRVALIRLMVPVSVGSAFLNNTPIVAMGIPAVRTWSRDHDISASKLLIPLSFAAMFGGMCTLMGTSTNLVAHGLLKAEGLEGFGFFELAGVGIPCTIVGWIYLTLVGPRLLPDRGSEDREQSIVEEALVEIEVEEEAALAGNTVEESGLRELPGLELRAIVRGDETLTEIDEETLREHDKLRYAPADESVHDILDPADYPGLKLSVSKAREMSELAESGKEQPHSVVVRAGSRLAGERVEDAGFEEKFNARVEDVRRGGGSVIDESVEDVKLKPGDTLLLETKGNFRQTHEDGPDFFVTSSYTEQEEEAATHQTTRQTMEMYAVLLVVAFIITMTVSGVLNIAVASLIGAVGLVFGRVISPAKARDSIDWEVLVVIGAALGLGQAMEASGGAEFIANVLVDSASGFGPIVLLAAVVVGSVILTSIITNNAAVALFFPIAISVASSQGIDPRGLIVGLTAAASMSMITPFGYQTNLMVYSAGDYRFSDFIRVGGALQIIFIVVVVAVIPFVWPF